MGQIIENVHHERQHEGILVILPPDLSADVDALRLRNPLKVPQGHPAKPLRACHVKVGTGAPVDSK